MVDGYCLTDADIEALDDDELLRLYSLIMGEMMKRHERALPGQWGPSEY